MRETTTLYKSIIAGIHRYEVKLDIAGTEYGMSDLVTLKTNVAAFSDDGPQLGLAVAQEMSVDVYASSADIPRMAELKPYYRVINDTKQSEWIQKGVFYLDTREKASSGIMHLTGFDNMLKAEALYPSSSLSWPATDIDVVREIAGFMNVTIDARTTAIMTSGYEVQLAPQMTMREMLQYIAAMYGGSFIFSDTGALLLVCVWNLDDSDPYTIAQKGISQSTRPAFPPCTGVRFIVSQSATEQTEIFSGDETGYVYEIECPFATQEIADSLLSKMRGMVYRPYSAEKVAADPALEIGDAVVLGEEESEQIISGIYSFDMNFNSACRPTFAAPGELEIDHEYTMDRVSSRSFKRMKREVYSEIKLLDDEINLTVKKGEVCAQISLEPEDITISGNRIQITSTNWSITKNGVMTAKSGTIGGWKITESGLNNTVKDAPYDTDLGVQINSKDSSIQFMSYADISPYVNTGLFIGKDPDNFSRQSIIFQRASQGVTDNLVKIYATPYQGSSSFYIRLQEQGVFGIGYQDDTLLQIGCYVNDSDQYLNVNATDCNVHDLWVYGDLHVKGQKDRLIETEHFGARCISAYETAIPYFGDIGQGVTDESGKCIVQIEEIFSETVDLEEEYQVFLQKEGPGDIWVQEKAKDHFTVKGTPGLKFAWELKAKQIDHKGKRLEEYKPKTGPRWDK